MIDFARRGRCFNPDVLAPNARRQRLNSFAVILVLCALVIVHRLYSLQIADFERWQDWALKQHFSEVTVASERGPIYDRSGNIMAVSVPAGSVYVRPRQVRERERVSAELAGILGIERSYVNARLDEKKPFVWIARQVPRQQAERVTALNMPGVGFVMESRRLYPYNQAASALLGKVGVDGIGLSGLEEQFEKQLHGEHLQTRITRDALGKTILISAKGDQLEQQRGDSLQLTIDASLQLIVDEELEAGRLAAKARSALAVMIDSDTGEILAMSQAPALNFNSDNAAGKGALRNAVAEAVFEPGSIMKPMVAAAAIERGVVRDTDMIDCEHGRFPFGRHTIKDVHPVDTVSFHDVVVRSSNIGMTKVGMKLGRKALYASLRDFGFGSRSGLGLAGESGGLLRAEEGWAAVDVATHSFGQGVAVTPLQMVRAMAAIANGGKLPELYLVSDGRDFQSKRIFSEATAERVQRMMYGVTEDLHGTGKNALISGVRVGGKTGTAQIARNNGRGYEPGAYNASFIGYVNAEGVGIRKLLTLMVVIQEPRGGSIYGGALAAPVFRKIMTRSLSYLSTRGEIGEEDLESQVSPPAKRGRDILISEPVASDIVRNVAYRQ